MRVFPNQSHTGHFNIVDWASASNKSNKTNTIIQPMASSNKHFELQKILLARAANDPKLIQLTMIEKTNMSNEILNDLWCYD